MFRPMIGRIQIIGLRIEFTGKRIYLLHDWCDAEFDAPFAYFVFRCS